MISATVLVLFYALIATISPLALSATLVMVHSDHPRANGFAFLGGFVLGVLAASVLGLTLGDAAVEGFDAHDTVEGLLALLLGVALIVTGLWERHTPDRRESQPWQGGPLLARLRHVEPAAVVPIAALLGFGGPKRLVLTFLAMTSISAADLGDLERLTLVVLYVAVATLVVWVPIGVVALAGDRADAVLGQGESWIASHAAVLRVRLAVGLGAALVVDGLVRVLS